MTTATCIPDRGEATQEHLYASGLSMEPESRRASTALTTQDIGRPQMYKLLWGLDEFRHGLDPRDGGHMNMTVNESSTETQLVSNVSAHQALIDVRTKELSVQIDRHRWRVFRGCAGLNSNRVHRED